MFNLSQGFQKLVSVYMQALYETLHDLVVRFFKFEKCEKHRLMQPFCENSL